MIRRTSGGFRTYLSDLSLLTPNAKKYLLGSFFIGMTFSSFLFLLNLYLRERGFTESTIGDVLSAGAIGMTVVSIPGAIFLSRVRLKPVLVITTILYTVFGLFTIYLHDITLIWIAYMFAGMASTFYRIASGPFFMRNSSRKERPYLFSLSFGISVIAGTITPFVLGKAVTVFMETFGYGGIDAHRLSLTIGMFAALFALVPFLMLKTPKQIPQEDRLVLNIESLQPISGLLLKLTLPHFIVGLGAGMIIPFLNLFFRDRFGQGPEEIGLFYALQHLTMFIGVMAAPALIKKLGMVRTIVGTELLSIPFMLILAFSYNLPLVLAAYLVRGMLMNMGHPIGNNFAMEMVPKSFHGLVNALLMFSWTGSWMVSTRVAGIVIENYGYTLSLLIAIVLYVLSALLYYVAFRRTETVTADGIIFNKEYRMAG